MYRLRITRQATHCLYKYLGFGSRFVRHTSPHTVIISNNMSVSEKDQNFKEELKKRLTPIQYHVTQEKGTERAFTGKYNKTSETGTYVCIVCNEELFSSDTKFDSSCGWPAFNNVLEQGKVKLTKDASHGMVRTEVTCSKCGAHLGHVFNDGPKPMRRRFCINSASLDFHPAVSDQ